MEPEPPVAEYTGTESLELHTMPYFSECVFQGDSALVETNDRGEGTRKAVISNIYQPVIMCRKWIFAE